MPTRSARDSERRMTAARAGGRITTAPRGSVITTSENTCTDYGHERRWEADDSFKRCEACTRVPPPEPRLLFHSEATILRLTFDPGGRAEE